MDFLAFRSLKVVKGGQEKHELLERRIETKINTLFFFFFVLIYGQRGQSPIIDITCVRN